MKIEIKKGKKFNDYTIKFSNVTEGAVLALKHSLEFGAQAGSPISADLLAFLKPAIKEVGIKFE